MSGSTIGGLVGASLGALTGNPAAVKWGFMLGSALGGVVDPDKVQGPRLDQASRPTAAEGVPIPFGYGTYPVGGHLVWAGEIVEHEVEEGGKGSSTVARNYTYTRAYAIAFGKGEATGIAVLTRNGKVVYDIRPGSTTLGQNAKFLSGCTIYLGSESQAMDPTIEAAVGVNESSPMKGTIYIVLEDDTTERGECAQWEAVVQKCGVVTALTAPAEPVLLVGSAQYRGLPASLGALSGTAPILARPYHAASSRDGLVLACETGSNDIEIYRWSGSIYVLQTISGATPGTAANAIGGVTVSDDGAWVICTAYNAQVIYCYQFNGVSTYTLMHTEAYPIYPQGVCFSPDESEIAIAGGAFDGSYVTRYTFNSGTGALSGAVSSPPVGGGIGHGCVDWYGTQILASHGSACKLFNASTLALVATASVNPAGRAFFSSDGFYVYHHNYSLDGATLVTVNTYTSAGSGYADTTITKDRAYLLVANATTANDLYSLSGATMTAITAPAVITGGTGALFTGLGPALDWYTVPDADGAYIDEEGVLQTGYVVGTTISSCGADLADIVADLCGQSGIASTEYDVTGLAGVFVKGFKCAAGSGADAYIEALAQAYFFDRGEWDKKIRFVKRGGASVGSLTTDDLVRRSGPSIKTTQVQEYELLRKVNVLTLNPATNYTVGKQSWERRVSTVQARGESTVELPLVASADTTAQIAAIKGKIAWSETEKRQFAVSLRDSKYTPTDVLTQTDHEGAVHRIRLTSTYEEGNIFTIEEAIRDRARVYASAAVGTTPATPPTTTPGLVGHTLFAALNLPQLRTQDNVPGLWIGATGMLDGWAGCKILMSVDGGVSYSVALTITEPTTMGALTAAITNSGTSLSVRVFGGALASATAAQVLMGENLSAVLSGTAAEVLAYTTATPTTAIKFDLTGLTRDIKNTGSPAHATDDQFMDINSAYFLPITQAAGTTLYFKAVGLGVSADSVTAVPIVWGGRTFIIDAGEVVGPLGLLDRAGNAIYDRAGQVINSRV